jgi:hypothetical protein
MLIMSSAGREGFISQAEIYVEAAKENWAFPPTAWISSPLRRRPMRRRCISGRSFRSIPK